MMLRDAIKRVSTAIAARPIVPTLTHYCCLPNELIGGDGRFFVGVPCETGLNALLPAVSVDALIKRLPEDFKVEQDAERVTFKSGRYRGSVKFLSTLEYTSSKPEGQRVPVDPAFLAVLEDMRPFVGLDSIHAWSCGVCIRNRRMYATNNRCLVRSAGVEIDLKIADDVIVPVWAIDFLLSVSNKLTGISATSNSMSFFWDDGSWMRTQLFDGKFPDNCDTIIESAGEPTTRVTSEWREAMLFVQALGENSVRVERNVITGRTEQMDVTVDVETDVDQVTAWDKRVLDIALPVGAMWNPGTWPKPSPFQTATLEGAFVGVRDVR